MKHEQRFALARDLCARFRDKHGDAFLVGGVYGSTARVTDTEWSDLELFCVIDGEGDTSRHVLIRGVPAGWRVMGRITLEQHLSHPSTRWPFLVGTLSSLQVLYGDGGLIRRWIALGESTPRERFVAALEEALPGLVWEGFGRILSCKARQNSRDPYLCVLEILFEMVTALSLLNRKWATHDYFQKVVDTFRFPSLPADYESLVVSLWETRNVDEMVSLSSRLVENFQALLEQEGVRIVDYAGAADIPI